MCRRSETLKLPYASTPKSSSRKLIHHLYLKFIKSDMINFVLSYHWMYGPRITVVHKSFTMKRVCVQ